MLKHRKTAAFILSLALCTATAAPVYSAFAEEEAAVETSGEELSAEITEADDALTSGDYRYSLTNDNTVCIEKYTGSDTDVSIPETIDGKTVEEIGSEAFFESTAVSVLIPAGVTYISENPFLESKSLKEINVAGGNERFYSKDGVLYEICEEGDYLRCYPQGKEGSSFTVPDGVSAIQTAAIYDTNLTELKLPSSLSNVERHGISYNEKLTSVDFSESMLYGIGDMALAYCTSLTDVKFSNCLAEIGGAAFAGCSSLSKIEFPDSLTTIRQNAFAATGLKSVTIPGSVTEIGYCAFGYNENLEPLSSFTIIGVTGSAAHIYCTDSDSDYDYANNFTFVDIENADLVTEAEDLENVVFGDYTYAEKNGEAYITSCVSIDSVIEVPAEINGLPVTRIYGGAFFQNQASEIILPDSVKEISPLAFYECTNLKKIKMPAALEKIDNQAFNDCLALESIDIPANCTSIGEEVFLSCTALKEFTVSDANSAYCAEDGVLYSADKTVIVAYPAAKADKSYKAPDSVREILLSAFFGCQNLEKADISSIVTIGNYAFESCTALKSVKLSKDLEKIGTLAFYNCNSLKSLRTYDKITEIGTAAIGYYYDETDTENGGDVLIEGFKLYAPEDSGGARYALVNKIECVSNTAEIFGANIEKPFLYVILAAAAAAVLAVIGIITSKCIKKKSEKKRVEQLRIDAKQKIEERTNSKEEKSNETE